MMWKRQAKLQNVLNCLLKSYSFQPRKCDQKTSESRHDQRCKFGHHFLFSGDVKLKPSWIPSCSYNHSMIFHAGIGELLFLVSENILSIIVLIVMTASVFISFVYTLVFVLKPYEPGRKEETNPLLSGCNSHQSEATDTDSKSSREKDSGTYFQMAVLAVVFALVIAVRFNSIKALLQLSWPSEGDENPEVRKSSQFFSGLRNF